MPPSQTNPPLQQYPIPADMPPQMPVMPKKTCRIGLIIALVLFILLFLCATGFGFWAFASRQDFKDHSDQKSAKAVQIAIQQEASKKDNEFLEKEKTPLKTYQGPAAYGSLDVKYPKTWSAYVIETDRAAIPVDGFFHPNFVPGVLTKTAYALRVQVTSQSYEQEMKQFDGKVKAGKVTVTPFIAKSVPGITGARIEGEINQGQKDTMVLLPIRDKTIKISTESQQFIGDFNNIILANLKFVP
jgi:hypothetical protein